MNHDVVIQAIIDDLLADKSIPAAYRNAVASTGRRWQCEIRGVKTITNRPVPADLPTMQGGCTCTELGRRKDCPVHGATA